MRALLLGALALAACAAEASTDDAEQLRHLFDRFAVLADDKDVAAQMELFTEDAVVVSRADGQVTELEGRDAIGAAFSSFLSQFDTVFHQNGQHVVTLDGDRADGTGYSIVVLGNADGRMTMGVIYSDDYVREDGGWKIARRESDFRWRDGPR